MYVFALKIVLLIFPLHLLSRHFKRDLFKIFVKKNGLLINPVILSGGLRSSLLIFAKEAAGTKSIKVRLQPVERVRTSDCQRQRTETRSRYTVPVLETFLVILTFD